MIEPWKQRDATLVSLLMIDFEKEIKSLWEDGELPFLVHLSGGNERQLISYFMDHVEPWDWIFSSHRNHYHYLLKAAVNGIDGRPRLEQMIRDGKSMFVYDKELNFLTSSVLAGTCCPAAGVAASIKEAGERGRVHCFVGDAAEDEGHFYEGVRYGRGHELPCTYVIEDNNRSCDTTRKQRRGTSEAFAWPSNVFRYTYTPTFPHGGVGTDKRVTFKEEAIARHLSSTCG